MGRTDIEDALQRLEKVTMEEVKMTAAEALKAIHGVGSQVGDKVDGVHDTLKAVEDRMRGVEDMLQVITGTQTALLVISTTLIIISVRC